MKIWGKQLGILVTLLAGNPCPEAGSSSVKQTSLFSLTSDNQAIQMKAILPTYCKSKDRGTVHLLVTQSQFWQTEDCSTLTLFHAFSVAAENSKSCQVSANNCPQSGQKRTELRHYPILQSAILIHYFNY